jgi:hypothetical protein
MPLLSIPFLTPFYAPHPTEEEMHKHAAQLLAVTEHQFGLNDIDADALGKLIEDLEASGKQLNKFLRGDSTADNGQKQDPVEDDQLKTWLKGGNAR